MRRLLLIMLLVILVPGVGVASDFAEPTVTIKPPPSYMAKRIVLFPLEIPSHVVRGVTYPIGLGLRYLEEKGVAEKVQNVLSNKAKTFWLYPIVEGGAGTGFGGGAGIKDTDLFHRQYLLGLSYRIHINMQQNADFSFAKPNAFTLFGKPVSYSLNSSFARSLLFLYYGIGNNSPNVQGLYSGNIIDTGVTLTYEPIKSFIVTPYVGVSLSNSGPKGDSGTSPSAQLLFPAPELTGFGNWVDYTNVGIRIAHDTRNAILSPEKGGIESFSYKNYTSFNASGYDYNRYELDARHYFRLWAPRQVFVLRGNFVANVPNGGNDIPFWRLATLDANSPLRGFVTGRFHDRASILFNAEYRFPVWRIIDGVLFYDTGRVLHNPADMSLTDMRYSVGGGFHIQIPQMAFFKFYVGYGGEGVNFILGASKPI